MKRIIAVLITLSLFITCTPILALSNRNGPSWKTLASTIKQKFVYVDTYTVTNTPYQCYYNKEKNQRLYFSKGTGLIVIEGELLKKLETVYAVNLKTTGQLINDYQLKTTMVNVQGNLNELIQLINTYVNLQSVVEKASGFMGDLLGIYYSNKVSAVNRASSLTIYNLVENELTNNKLDIDDAKSSLESIVNIGITNAYMTCIEALGKGVEKYNSYGEKIKSFEYAQKIMEDFDFAATTYKAIWGYTETTIIPRLPKDIWDKLYKFFFEWTFPSLINGFFGAYDKTADHLLVLDIGNAYNNYNDLVNFYKSNNVTAEDFAAIGDILTNSYTDTLTDKQKKLLQLIGKYYPDYLQLFYSVTQNRGYVTNDFATTGFRTVNELFGAMPVFTADSLYKNDIENLKNLGVLDKTTLYTYKSNVTREDFCEIVYKMYKYLYNNEAKVQLSDWFIDTINPNVSALKSLGYINGKSNLFFQPTVNITRNEAAIAIGKILEKAKLRNSTKVTVKDCINLDLVSQSYVKYVAGLGVMKPENGNFYPGKSISFQELFTICNRVINLKKKFDIDLTTQEPFIFIGKEDSWLDKRLGTKGERLYGVNFYEYICEYKKLGYTFCFADGVVYFTCNRFNFGTLKSGMSFKEVQDLLGYGKVTQNKGANFKVLEIKIKDYVIYFISSSSSSEIISGMSLTTQKEIDRENAIQQQEEEDGMIYD